jgi:arylsulfatase A-like enzyme
MPWDQKHKEWAAMMEHLDRHVGEIIETLEKLEILDKSIVFFASDNGYSHWGYFNRKRWENDPLFDNKGPWKGGKFLPLDGGSRVPFFVNWPGKIKPGTSSELVALYDFPATACDLAGIDAPVTDGKSLVPLLMGKSPAETDFHEYLYWENGSFGAHSQAARFRNWYAYREHPDKPLQLWDLSSDIPCNIDVSESNQEIVEEALRIFQESHEPSEWYVNPGDPEELIERKRVKAEKEGSIQEPVRANSRYPEDFTKQE